jgi:hypothetical protein
MWGMPYMFFLSFNLMKKKKKKHAHWLTDSLMKKNVYTSCIHTDSTLFPNYFLSFIKKKKKRLDLWILFSSSSYEKKKSHNGLLDYWRKKNSTTTITTTTKATINWIVQLVYVCLCVFVCLFKELSTSNFIILLHEKWQK